MADSASPDPWVQLTSLVASFRADVQRATGERVGSAGLRARGKEVVQHYFRVARPELESLGITETERLDTLMQSLLEATNGRAMRTTYLSLTAQMRDPLVALEGQREMRLGQSRSRPQRSGPQSSPGVTTAPTDTEQKILSALDRLVPTAGLSYRQAIADLSNAGRVSFRGPANELREALREVMDELAPDEDVMNAKGFQRERGQTKPTQKQKVRYILRSQGVSGTAREAPERAAELIEEMFSSFARSVYQRSSIPTHVSLARRDVLQMKMYVDTVLAELLQIHS